jgi:hypothetical protein
MTLYLLDPDALAAGVEVPYRDDLGLTVFAPHGGFGKWRHYGMQHSGWDWVLNDAGYPLVYDAGRLRSARPICEMCEKERIRFVHVLRHPEYRDALTAEHVHLHVGENCAAHMTGDHEKAHNLERAARKSGEINDALVRFSYMCDGAEWWDEGYKQRAVVKNMYLTVWWDNDGYRARYWHRGSGYSRTSSRRFPDIRVVRRVCVKTAIRAWVLKPWDHDCERPTYPTDRRSRKRDAWHDFTEAVAAAAE